MLVVFKVADGYDSSYIINDNMLAFAFYFIAIS